MEAAPGLDAAIAAARAVQPRFSTASDDELLADGEAIEALGRLVDGLRVAFAGEVERRSTTSLGDRRLSLAHGARDGVELVQLTARIGHRDAKQRVALGRALAPAVDLRGEEMPGRHPEVSAAVAEGRIGLESARVIVSAVEAVRARAVPQRLATMTASLVQAAETSDVDAVAEAAQSWTLAIDPDGAEPRERVQRRKRALRLGRTLADGTTSLSMVLTPEDLAFMRELLASRRRGVQLCRTEPAGPDDPDLDGPEWRPEGDDRSRAQQDYDTALEALRAGANTTEHAPPLHETVVTVTAAEVEARGGQGWAPGILAGLPMPVVERRACTGGVRLMVTGPHGEPLHLSRSQRLFTAAQRKALSVAAGGRCQFPGCRVPDPYLEAHHVRWWKRHGGRTDIGNGVVLCSFHHHLVHAENSPVRIELHRGGTYLVPRSWWGPPDPGHRLRTGPPPGRRAA